MFELILKAVYNSFRDIARMKYEEFGDDSDAQLIKQSQGLAFQQLMDGKVSNIFQKVIEMNADVIFKQNKMDK